MSDTVRSSDPIEAVRVFRLTDDHRLKATASDYTYEGPVATNPVPPYTADEWERVAEIHDAVYTNMLGRPYRVRESNVALEHLPQWELLRLIEDWGERRVLRLMERQSDHEGFHAFRSIERLREQGYTGGTNNPFATGRDYPVLGHVELFGRVVEYERGYRAEKIRIQRLVVEPESATPEIIEALESRYHCEVEEKQWQTSGEKSESTKSSWTPVMHPSGGHYLTPAVSETPKESGIGKKLACSGLILLGAAVFLGGTLWAVTTEPLAEVGSAFTRLIFAVTYLFTMTVASIAPIAIGAEGLDDNS